VLTCPRGELADGRQITSLQRRRRAQVGGVGSGKPGDAALVVPNPGDDLAVVEAQPQLTELRNSTADAFDDADDIGGLFARRHEINHPDVTVRRLPLSLQDQSVFLVSAMRARPSTGGCEQPPSGFGRVQQRRKAGGGVKVRKAEPVDGPVATNQRGSVQVADDGVVLDPGHAGQLVEESGPAGPDTDAQTGRWREMGPRRAKLNEAVTKDPAAAGRVSPVTVIWLAPGSGPIFTRRSEPTGSPAAFAVRRMARDSPTAECSPTDTSTSRSAPPELITRAPTTVNPSDVAPGTR
jgi:hypothetical protein